MGLRKARKKSLLFRHLFGVLFLVLLGLVLPGEERAPLDFTVEPRANEDHGVVEKDVLFEQTKIEESQFFALGT